jgi:hypothetical protein
MAGSKFGRAAQEPEVHAAAAGDDQECVPRGGEGDVEIMSMGGSQPEEEAAPAVPPAGVAACGFVGGVHI